LGLKAFEISILKTQVAAVNRKKATHELAPLRPRRFTLSAKQYAALVKMLDNPPPPGPKLKALMRRTPLWEKAC
jgi:uncharacterized protein (DUF1778 family)